MKDLDVRRDLGVAVAVLLVAVLVPDPDRAGGPAFAPLPTAAVLLAIVTCAALVLRRRHPWPVLLATLAGAGAATVVTGERTPLVLAPLVALFTVALRGNRTRSVAAGALAFVALAGTQAVATGFSPDLLTNLAWCAVAVAAGDGLASRRAYTAAVSVEREQESQRRVVEERLRIARELHDVVAHHIAVVSVQAGVASYLLPGQPEAAQEALGHVRRAAGSVLDELGGLLDVLRQPDEPSLTAPAPGLDRLEDLVESFAPAGLHVRWSVSGSARSATPGVDVVAYRVVQEALTNAGKHGTGTATLALRYLPELLELEVENPVGRASAGRSGYGLTGMRERAHAVGGTVTIAPVINGRFRVTVLLPMPAVAAMPAGVTG